MSSESCCLFTQHNFTKHASVSNTSNLFYLLARISSYTNKSLTIALLGQEERKMFFWYHLISPLDIIFFPWDKFEPLYRNVAWLSVLGIIGNNSQSCQWQLWTLIGNDSRFQYGIDLHDVFLMLEECGHASELFMLNDLLGAMISGKVICHIVGQKCHLCLMWYEAKFPT